MTPWADVTLSPAALATPTMLSCDERRYLFWLIRDCYSGAGRIIELGPFVGGSTVAMADALMRHKPHALPIITIDRFSWFDSHGLDLPDERDPGADFRDIFWRYCEAYRPWIDLRRATLGLAEPDIPSADWADAEPIEILFVDAAKDWKTTRSLLSLFAPSFIPGFTRLVFQDYLWFDCCHLPVILESLSDYIEWESELPHQGYTATFRVTAIPPAVQLAALPASARQTGQDSRIVKRLHAQPAKTMNTGGPPPVADSGRMLLSTEPESSADSTSQIDGPSASAMLASAQRRASQLRPPLAERFMLHLAVSGTWLDYQLGELESAVATAIRISQTAKSTGHVEYLRFVLAWWAERLTADHPDRLDLALDLYRAVYTTTAPYRAIERTLAAARASQTLD